MRRTVNGPVKAPKSRKNQPQDFQEAMAPALPQQRGTVRSGSRVWLRMALWIVWAAAAVAAGVGIGLLLRGTLRHETAAAPDPVASAIIQRAPAPQAPILKSAAASVQPALAPRPATAILQAQAGIPFTLAAASVYHPAAAPDALQPGYSSAVHAQGSVGTQPVR